MLTRKIGRSILDFERIKNFFLFLAHINLIISLGTIGFAYLTASLLSLPPDFIFYFICFLVASFVYSINRLTDIREDVINNPRRTEFVEKQSNLFFVYSLLSLIIALILSYLHSFLTFLIILLPIIFVIVYSIKWIPKSISLHKRRLKEIFLMKSIIVSLGWALIPFYVIIYLNTFLFGIFFISFFIFLRIFIGTIMFDIRDVKGDKINGIQTIPVCCGIKESKNIILFLNFLSFIILFVGCLLGLLPMGLGLIIAAFGFVMGVLYIHLMNKINIRFLCDVIVDSEYFLFGVISFIIALI